MAVTPSAGAHLQQLLDADPQYRKDLATFQGGDASQKPQAWIALANDLNRIVPYAQLEPGRYAATIGGDGRVNIQDQNNPWTSPGTWGPIAVGALGGAAALGAFGPAAGGATTAATTAPEIATTASGPLSAGTLGALGPTTAGGVTAASGGSTGILGTIGSFLPNSAGGWLNLAQQLGPLLTAGGAGAAQGRATDAQLAQGSDRNAIALYQSLLGNNAQQNAFSLGVGDLANRNAATDLAQRNFALEAPNVRAGTAVRGDILANAQDASLSGISPNIPVPTISGGLRPSMFSPATRQLGGVLSSQALANQQKGDTFAPLPALPTWQAPPAPPTLSGLPQPSAWNNIETTGGNILNLVGAFGNALNRYRPVSGQATDGGDQTAVTNAGYI